MPGKWNCVTACALSYAAVLSVFMQRQRRLLHAWLRKCFNFLVSSKPSLDTQNKASMLSEIFLNSRNETHLARVSIFVHLVTDVYICLSIYSISFILFYFILFYFILFYFILLLSFIDDQNFFITFCFHLFCDNLPCSGMFQNVPECSGMFHVPGFVNAPHLHIKYCIQA